MDLILRKKREILDIREREKEINRQRRVKERKTERKRAKQIRKLLLVQYKTI